jgi:hypothetical protein
MTLHLPAPPLATVQHSAAAERHAVRQCSNWPQSTPGCQMYLPLSSLSYPSSAAVMSHCLRLLALTLLCCWAESHLRCMPPMQQAGSRQHRWKLDKFKAYSLNNSVNQEPVAPTRIEQVLLCALYSGGGRLRLRVRVRIVRKQGEKSLRIIFCILRPVVLLTCRRVAFGVGRGARATQFDCGHVCHGRGHV